MNQPFPDSIAQITKRAVGERRGTSARLIAVNHLIKGAGARIFKTRAPSFAGPWPGRRREGEREREREREGGREGKSNVERRAVLSRRLIEWHFI